jgi:hypothetical protein
MSPKSLPETEQVQLLRTLLIVQLRLAGVPQRNIAKIARCGNDYVSSIIKHIPKDLIRPQAAEE